MSRRIVALSAAAPLAAAALVGCTPASPTRPSHTAAATNTPAFASDEAALSAATDAYAAYLKMSDTIAHDGGKNPERIKTVATGEALKDAQNDIKKYQKLGVHTTGDTTFDSTKLQTIDTGAQVQVSVYTCDDVSDIDVIVASGKSLVEQDRNPRTPFEIIAVSGEGHGLVVAERNLWQGEDFC